MTNLTKTVFEPFLTSTSQPSLVREYFLGRRWGSKNILMLHFCVAIKT